MKAKHDALEAASIQGSCRVRNKDIRKFLDGIYVSDKATVIQHNWTLVACVIAYILECSPLPIKTSFADTMIIGFSS